MTKAASNAPKPGWLIAFIANASSEAKKFLVIAAYLWVLFGLFALYKSILLPHEEIIYGQVFAIVNAIVLAKVVFVAESLHVGESFESRPLIYPILFKSALFAVILVCFELVEEIVKGALRDRTIAVSISAVAGGTLKGIVSLGIIVFIVLIPFFAFREMASVVGHKVMRDLLFVRRAKLTPTPPP